MKIKREQLKKGYKVFLPYLIIMVIAVLMLWPQIQSHSFISGDDYYFHMARTYETAMQIKTGHFSYFLSLFSWQHNARIVNAVYGPLGGYVSGLILLLAKSWYRWGLIMSFIALILAGGTMDYLGNYWHVNPIINLLLSTLYMLSTPLNDFVFSRTFAGFGSSLVPLVFLMGSEILRKKDINPIKLALIMFLIIEIHLMTFMFSILALIPCALIGVLSKNREALIKHICEGALLMIFLSFNVWGSILEVYGSNFHHILPTVPNPQIGTQSFSTIMNTYPKTPSLLGVIPVVLIIITIMIWILIIKHANYGISALILIGLVFIWLSSEWFPWQLVAKRIGIVTNLIQFPKRFLPFGLVPLYLSAGYLLSHFSKTRQLPRVKLGLIIMLLLIMTGWSWHSNYNYLTYLDHNYHRQQVIRWINMQWLVKPNPNKLRNSLRNDHPGQFMNTVGKKVTDYLPTNNQNVIKHHPYGEYAKTYYKPINYKWSISQKKREHITIDSPEYAIRTVPFAKYAHTQVMLNHKQIHPRINNVGAMILHLKVGKNHLSIWYQPSLWYEIGVWISILTWMGLLIYMLYLKFGMYVSI